MVFKGVWGNKGIFFTFYFCSKLVYNRAKSTILYITIGRFTPVGYEWISNANGLSKHQNIKTML